ncbi:MAG TPA: PIN domain nuclease, partial [Desulfomicrobiaceae bacterium]|nr:PIN domain nuclease [Desulfomicrobiaceae bacterium]
MILVDSSVWIDYFNGRITWQTNLLDQLLQQVPIITGDIILTEVLQGFRTDKEYTKAKEVMAILECRTLLDCRTAAQCAENYRRLRRKGVTVRKTIDIIIGTFCIVHEIPLLHADKDFLPMEQHLGLKTVSSTSHA